LLGDNWDVSCIKGSGWSLRGATTPAQDKYMINDASNPDAANPTLWAPFVVVGEARSAR
jgi:hypothetical protein